MHFDAFQLGVGLGTQLLADLFGVVPGLLDDPGRLGLGLLESPFVLGIGVGDLLCGLRVVLQLVADGLLLVLHQGANRRHDVSPHQEDDDREPDELSDEG